MQVKYNRLSSLSQSGNRLSADKTKYDLVLLDRVSGTVAFKERPKGKELVKLVEDSRVKELVVEELSRLGCSTGNVIQTLEWLEEKEVNVTVRNIGLQSRPNNKKNPIWKMITAVISSLYEMELQNIKERTTIGRQVYVQQGGVLGRTHGSKETETKFLKKEPTQRILKSLKKGYTIREVCKFAGCSNKTVIKTKKIAIKHGLISQKDILRKKEWILN